MKIAVFAASVAILTACGGGGDDAPTPTTSDTTYNLDAALKSITASGQTVNFEITASNGCVGSGVYGVSPANRSTTFEGRSALEATSVLNISYTNCTPATFSQTTTTYYDSNYLPLGSIGNYYTVYTLNVPTSVKVGDVGVIGNGVRYTDSTKTVRNGSVQLSYIVEPESASTAFITVATKVYNASNTLETTQLTKYRINTANSLSLESLTIQYANGVNVVFTRR